jgi:4-hydroxy-2-oxoglutarate aldolase
MTLQGVFLPLVTPFLEDGSLDLASFEATLASYAGEDLAGYVVFGSSGEASSLAEEEKATLLRAVRRSSGERTLLAGTGLESTKATIALTRKAAELGADGALVLPPHYYRPQMTTEALVRHYEAVADASPIPLVLYSIPQFTGLSLTAAVVGPLARHPRIAGIKESSGDVALLGRLLAAVSPPFAVFCGAASVLYPALVLGAAGGILALANVLPGPVTALYRAAADGDHPRARRLQEALAAAAAAVTGAHGVAGLKRAMQLTGRRAGAVRAPLLPAPASVDAEIRGALARVDEAAR